MSQVHSTTSIHQKSKHPSYDDRAISLYLKFNMFGGKKKTFVGRKFNLYRPLYRSCGIMR